LLPLASIGKKRKMKAAEPKAPAAQISETS